MKKPTYVSNCTGKKAYQVSHQVSKMIVRRLPNCNRLPLPVCRSKKLFTSNVGVGSDRSALTSALIFFQAARCRARARRLLKLFFTYFLTLMTQLVRVSRISSASFYLNSFENKTWLAWFSSIVFFPAFALETDSTVMWTPSRLICHSCTTNLLPLRISHGFTCGLVIIHARL